MAKTFSYLDTNDKEVDYEVEDREIRVGIATLIYLDFFSDKKLVDYASFSEQVIESLVDFIDSKGLLDTLTKEYEFELKEYFREDAFEYDKQRGGEL